MEAEGEQLILTSGIWKSPWKRQLFSWHQFTFYATILTPRNFDQATMAQSFWCGLKQQTTALPVVWYQAMCKTDVHTPFPTLTLIPASTLGKNKAQGWSVNLGHLFLLCTKNVMLKHPWSSHKGLTIIFSKLPSHSLRIYLYLDRYFKYPDFSLKVKDIGKRRYLSHIMISFS